MPRSARPIVRRHPTYPRLNLETGQAVIIGKHENGVCRIRYDDPTQLLISGSWDASLKLWNPFAEPDQALRHTISLPHKVFAMDTVPIYTGAPTVEAKDPTPRLVVAMAERLVHIYNLRTVRDALDANELEDASKPEQTRESSLKFMLRDVRCMPEGIGYATSSIEGRIAVEFFDPSPEGQAQKYAFKCHRKEVDGEDVVFPIHALAFDPRYGTRSPRSGSGSMCCRRRSVRLRSAPTGTCSRSRLVRTTWTRTAHRARCKW